MESDSSDFSRLDHIVPSYQKGSIWRTSSREASSCLGLSAKKIICARDMLVRGIFVGDGDPPRPYGTSISLDIVPRVFFRGLQCSRHGGAPTIITSGREGLFPERIVNA